MKPSEFLKSVEWIQGNLFLYSSNNPSKEIVGCCMLGAIMVSISDKYKTKSSGEINNAIGDFKIELQNIVNERYNASISIPRVNDTLIKSKEEAVKLLEETEKRLRIE
jgi:hypothetical protein